jgi:ABC-2 type transport system ATP-binding protein
MISVQNVTKRYGSVLALDDVSFEVSAGEVLGFLGPNGAGKTTTMKILTCYIVANAGTVTVAGYDVLERSLEVRRRVGYLPESVPLYSDMRVIDYLRFIARAREVPAKERTPAIARVVSECGLGPMLGAGIGELSKGYRQRLGLAQAMIHNPDILILDEATSGLDPSQIVEIRGLIREIGREKTVIFSTHVLQEVSAVCSRVLIINEGRLVADDTPEALRARASRQQTSIVQIKGPAEAVEQALRALSGVRTCRRAAADGNVHEFRVESELGVEIGEKIFELVRDRRWTLRELRTERATLEDVFLALTKADASSPDASSAKAPAAGAPKQGGAAT